MTKSDKIAEAFAFIVKSPAQELAEALEYEETIGRRDEELTAAALRSAAKTP